jgi:transposase InsO family protein
MRLHGNARTCPHSRRLIAVRVLEQGWTLAAAAEAAGASVRTASKWVARYRAEGEDGLADRSSEPFSIPNRTREERVELIAFLRRLRMTAAEIAEVIGMPLSTVSAVLTRIGLGKLSRLEAVEPANRYEKQLPGELVHIDVKKLVRIEKAGHRVSGNRRGSRKGAGWEYVHVCVDDATRLAYVEVLPDEKAATAVGFLRRAVAHYAVWGIQVRKVLTDNGPAYISILHALACTALGIKHSRTRPYRPRTNGKAERFIRTMLGGWAYGAIYGTSNERTAALPGWLDYYNRRRPHGSLSHQPPLTRLHAIRNNVPGSYN